MCLVLYQSVINGSSVDYSSNFKLSNQNIFLKVISFIKASGEHQTPFAPISGAKGTIQFRKTDLFHGSLTPQDDGNNNPFPTFSLLLVFKQLPSLPWQSYCHLLTPHPGCHPTGFRDIFAAATAAVASASARATVP